MANTPRHMYTYTVYVCTFTCTQAYTCIYITIRQNNISHRISGRNYRPNKSVITLYNSQNHVQLFAFARQLYTFIR